VESHAIWTCYRVVENDTNIEQVPVKELFICRMNSIFHGLDSILFFPFLDPTRAVIVHDGYAEKANFGVEKIQTGFDIDDAP